MLSRGFAVASNSLNVFGNNCNDLLASETASMLKEKVRRARSARRAPMGWGCSGGSYQGHQIADNYPGVLDGVVAGCSFPDVAVRRPTTPSSTPASCTTLLHAERSRHVHQEQQRAVAGFGVRRPPSPTERRGQAARPRREFARALCPRRLRYDAAVQPVRRARHGLRPHGRTCTAVDPATGFALRPLDNTGIQYGLDALGARDHLLPPGSSTSTVGVGGLDRRRRARRPSGRWPTRSAAEAAYRTGRILDTGAGLATTPVIDYRAYADHQPGGDIHMNAARVLHPRTVARAPTARRQPRDARGGRRYGLFGMTSPVLRGALTQMDEWLIRLSTRPDLGQPGRSLRPSRAASPTPAGAGTRRPAGSSRRCPSTTVVSAGGLYPAFPTPRMVAGAPLADDVVACAKQPVRAADYPRRPSAARSRLRSVFPGGVCDWSRTGIGQTPLAGTWQVIR